MGGGKTGRQRGTATQHMDKRSTLDQGDQICMNQDAGSSQLMEPGDFQVIIIIIIIITDLYSAFRSEDTEVLDAAQED